MGEWARWGGVFFAEFEKRTQRVCGFSSGQRAGGALKSNVQRKSAQGGRFVYGGTIFFKFSKTKPLTRLPGGACDLTILAVARFACGA
jgi:hypothetical protein